MVLEQVGPILYHVEKKDQPTSLTGGRLIETKDPTPSCISLDIRRVKPKQSRKQNLFSTEDMARTRLEAIRESEGPFEIPQLLFVVESKELRNELITQVGNLHVLPLDRWKRLVELFWHPHKKLPLYSEHCKNC